MLTKFVVKFKFIICISFLFKLIISILFLP